MSVHQFGDYLRRSKSDAQIDLELRKLAEIPLFAGCRFVPTTEAIDRMGGDYEMTAPDGRVQFLDVKYRHSAVSARWVTEPDVTIEWLSVKEANKPGWTVKDGGLTDLIVYMWRDWPDSYAFDFRFLRAAAVARKREWRVRFGEVPVSNDGYTTVCSFVPVSAVNHAIAEICVARVDTTRRVLPPGKIDFGIDWHDHARLISEHYGADEAERIAHEVLRQNYRQLWLA